MYWKMNVDAIFNNLPEIMDGLNPDDFIDKNDFAIIVNQYKSHLRRIQKQIYDVRYEININNNPTLGF